MQQKIVVQAKWLQDLTYIDICAEGGGNDSDGCLLWTQMAMMKSIFNHTWPLLQGPQIVGLNILGKNQSKFGNIACYLTSFCFLQNFGKHLNLVTTTSLELWRRTGKNLVILNLLAFFWVQILLMLSSSIL